MIRAWASRHSAALRHPPKKTDQQARQQSTGANRSVDRSIGTAGVKQTTSRMTTTGKKERKRAVRPRYHFSLCLCLLHSSFACCFSCCYSPVAAPGAPPFAAATATKRRTRRHDQKRSHGFPKTRSRRRRVVALPLLPALPCALRRYRNVPPFPSVVALRSSSFFLPSKCPLLLLRP